MGCFRRSLLLPFDCCSWSHFDFETRKFVGKLTLGESGANLGQSPLRTSWLGACCGHRTHMARLVFPPSIGSTPITLTRAAISVLAAFSVHFRYGQCTLFSEVRSDRGDGGVERPQALLDVNLVDGSGIGLTFCIFGLPILFSRG